MSAGGTNAQTRTPVRANRDRGFVKLRSIFSNHGAAQAVLTVSPRVASARLPEGETNDSGAFL